MKIKREHFLRCSVMIWSCVSIIAGLLFITPLEVMAGKKRTDVENTFQKPDFAFPKTVSENALKVLESADSKEKPLRKVAAAIQLSLARNMISAENAPGSLRMLDSLAAVSEAPYKQIYYTLESSLYVALYNRSPWIYNERNLPADDVPENLEAWSKGTFARKVLELTDRSLSQENILRDIPLSEIKEILDPSFDSYEYFSSIYDFIAIQSVSALSAFTDAGRNIIPFYPKTVSKSLEVELSDKILFIRDNEISYFSLKKNYAPLSFWINSKCLDNMSRIEAYKSFPDSRYAGNLLVDLRVPQINDSTAKNVYKLLVSAVKAYPEADYVPSLKNKIEALSRRNIRARVPGQVLAGNPIAGKATLGNMNEGWILLLSVPENTNLNPYGKNALAIKKKILRSLKVVDAVKVSVPGEVPFESNVEFSFKGQKYGCYVAVPSLSASSSDIIADCGNLEEIRVSDLRVIQSWNPYTKDSGETYVVSGSDQSPVENARVRIYKTRYGKPEQLLSTVFTGSDGKIGSNETGNILFKINKGDDKLEYSSDIFYDNAEFIDKDSIKTVLLTDLSIYKPGDKVQMTAISYNVSKKLIASGIPMEIILMDPNSQPVDTLSLVTDDYGRVSGEFLLPSTGITGNFSIRALYRNNWIETAFFTVAEYKAPSFFVEIDGMNSNYKPGDTIDIDGYVKTYSGMPVADAEISFNIESLPWFWWFRSGNVPANGSYGGTVMADGKGRFSIKLPTASLVGTPYESALYSLNVSAVSSAGETQKATPVRFSLGNAFSIVPEGKDRIEVSSDLIEIPVKVLDLLSNPVEKEVSYKLFDCSNDSTAVSSGVFKSPMLRIPADRLPSGKYILRLCLESDVNCKSEKEFVVFRSSDKKPPFDTPLWVPVSEYFYKPTDKTINVRYGSSYENSWILCTVIDSEGKIERKWIKSDASNSIVSIPVADKDLYVQLIGMHNLQSETSTVKLRSYSESLPMKMQILSFRDKTVPGKREQWKFRFTIGDDIPSGCIPALAVMTDKALDALAPFSWNFNIYSGFNMLNHLYMTQSQIGDNYFNAYPDKRNSYTTHKIWSLPMFNLFGCRSFFSYGGIRIRGAGGTDSTVLYESVVDQVKTTSMTLGENNVMMASAKMRSGADTTMETEEDAMESVDGENMSELRPMEYPLAFFKPNLLSDEKGNLDLSFEMPDFNTTWKLQLLGYNRELKSVLETLYSQASKPVMVSSLLPRFLRTEDKVRLAATLYNNSDSESEVRGKIEILNPADGTILFSQEYGPYLLDSMGSKVIFAEFDTPVDEQVVCFRAFVSTDEYSDGEQSFVSILPAVSPVFDSYPFYLAPEDTVLDFRVPEFKSDATVTLQYCDNPVWTCVTALPEITTAVSDNILSKIYAFFGNAVASGLTLKYPEIPEAIKKWNENPKDSVLVSPLQKNGWLKDFDLNSTIWVQDALSESLRMSKLETLSDINGNKAIQEKLLKDMLLLQNADGGWSWCPQMKSSAFITGLVLSRLGMLKEMGFLEENADLRKAISAAVKYCDSEIVRYVESSGNKISLSILNWLYIRSHFNVDPSAGFGRIRQRGLSEINSRWRELGIYDAACAAILLAENKSYRNTSLSILESLTQKAVVSQEKGMYYDNLSSGYDGHSRLMTTAKVLDAFSHIRPQAPQIDKIRQWLLIQRQTQNWGSDRDISEVIYSILSSGTKWTSVDTTTGISLDGRPLDISSRAALTGEFSVVLKGSDVSGKTIGIKKSSDHPAWGGVMSQYILPIEDIKAESVPDLSIRKDIFAVEESSDGTELKSAQLKSGMKVRVVLTIESGRDLEYVSVSDSRAACFEPVVQLSGYSFQDGVGAYRESRDTATNFFIDFLPKGTHVLSYECYVEQSGEFSSGIAVAQSQYYPMIVARSDGKIVKVLP